MNSFQLVSKFKISCRYYIPTFTWLRLMKQALTFFYVHSTLPKVLSIPNK